MHNTVGLFCGGAGAHIGIGDDVGRDKQDGHGVKQRLSAAGVNVFLLLLVEKVHRALFYAARGPVLRRVLVHIAGEILQLQAP